MQKVRAPQISHIGFEDIVKTLTSFRRAGNEALIKIREIATSPHHRKVLRTWGIQDAAKMTGVSVPTLRKYESEGGIFGKPDYDENNRRVYTLERINHYRDILNTRFKRPTNSNPMIVAIANFKGGSSKTTTTIHCAQKCALEGLRTLLIDFDPQGTSTFICGGIIPDIELDYDDTIANALQEEPSLVKNIIRKTAFHGLEIIPGNLALQDVELGLPNPRVNNHEKLGSPAFRLELVIDQIKDDYDVIFIDCGPNLGILTINALTVANGLLITIPPNMNDFASFVTFCGTLLELYDSIKSKKPTLEFFRILLTKHDGSKEAMYITDLIRTLFSGYVLSNYMCQTIEISKATNDLGTVYEVSRPRGSKEAYNRAITHLDNVNNEIIDLFKQVWDLQSEQHQTSNHHEE